MFIKKIYAHIYRFRLAIKLATMTWTTSVSLSAITNSLLTTPRLKKNRFLNRYRNRVRHNSVGPSMIRLRLLKLKRILRMEKVENFEHTKTTFSYSTDKKSKF